MTVDEGKEALSGTVEDIKFRNEQNGYTVLEIGCEDELVTAVGVFTDIYVGESVELAGTWMHHPTFGRQFKADAFVRRAPHTTEQLYRYLAAGAVKGIGRATAEKIIEKFGEDTFDILENHPEKLATIRGISIEKAEKIQENFKHQAAIRHIMIALETYGMTPRECIVAFDAFGPNTVERVLQNPFELCEIGEGIGFERAEMIAQALPNPPADSCRVRAGIIYIVRRNLYANGHTCIPREKLIKIAAAYLSVSEDEADIQTDALLEQKSLMSHEISGREFIFLRSAYQDEQTISKRIQVLLKFPPPQSEALEKEIDAIEVQDKITYSETQRKAIKTALEQGILILTGGPGTGKTTTLNGILHLFEKQGLNVSLAAPTGRAAKRMTELTGREAKTMHRLLEVEWDKHGQPYFQKNLRNPLECDALILDELSMVDIHLFASLLEALPFGCRLVMVGDSDQLPPVGAGNVLSDLIDSELLPVVALNEVFRQAMNSLIIMNAHDIVRGKMPELKRTDADFFFMERKAPWDTANTVAELYTQRLPKAYDFSPLEDIQVLCPSKKGEVGTVNLNRLLQEKVNPPDNDKEEIKVGFRIFREGDKVMQNKNNYNIGWDKDDGESGEGIFNGDIGYIEKINERAGTVKILFDDRHAVYTGEELSELELAYAVTVHKSQGSEFKAVILPVMGIPQTLCYRNLLYTAVTRAKEKLILVGNSNIVAQMVANDKNTRRYSALQTFLKEGIQVSKGDTVKPLQ